MIDEKIILDACCGSRMFWFDKEHPLALYTDIRDEEYVLCDGRDLEISPDMQIDFRDMPFEDESFRLVVFDPPHVKNLGMSSWMYKKYGRLEMSWEYDLKKGFNECWRVLQDYGVLIFKWSEVDITVRECLDVFEREPLFGHTTGKNGKTKWMCFMKLPKK